MYRLTVQCIGCMYRVQCTGLEFNVEGACTGCSAQGAVYRVQCIACSVQAYSAVYRVHVQGAV